MNNDDKKIYVYEKDKQKKDINNSSIDIAVNKKLP